MLVCAVLFSMLVSTSWATFGLDVSQSVTTNTFQCFKNRGYEFAIVRAYQETGQVDPNAVQTIKNARNAGINYVDAYMNPCFQCGNPSKQIFDTVSNLRQQDANFGMLWVNVGGNWSNNISANKQFLLEMINQTNILTVTWGIHSSAALWNPIIGSTADFGYPPLWYVHNDNNPSFGDFQPFGGWKNPSIKQYVTNANECDININKDFY